MTDPPPQRMISMLGLPGSGKSTQAKVLAGELGGAAVSVGDWLRTLAAGGDAGARSTVAGGDPISPDQYRRFLRHTFEQVRSSVVVFDGSPRDERQVAIMAEVLRSHRPPGLVRGVLLELPVSRAAARIRTRRLAGDSPRADDAQEIAAWRIARQASTLARLSASFGALWPLATIDTSCRREVVTEQILAWLGGS